jgi:tetratricopeptide (TPR) repeat protein
MSKYKPQPRQNEERLGPPTFAKITAVIVIVLALIIIAGQAYKKQYRIQQALSNQAKRVFSPREFRYEQNDAQSLHLRAKSLIKQGRYKEAEIWAQKSLQAKENYYRAYMDLGVVYSSRGDFIKAEEVFKKALQYIGNDTFDLEIIYGDLGLIYLVERRFDAAWDYLCKAYKRKTFLGNDFWSDSRLKFVIENNRVEFLKQVENDNKFPLEISQRLNRLRRLLGINNNEVARDCQQYLSDNPGSVYSYAFRALFVSALFRKGEYEKSLEQLRMVEFEKNLPASYIPWVKVMYAFIYDKLGETQKALDYLNDVIANYPNYKSISRANELLERIKSGNGQGETAFDENDYISIESY